jgi:Cu2+-containing amine oxidase
MPSRKSPPKAARPRASAARKPRPPQTVSADFLAALASDFARHGAAAIEATREANPANYLKLVAELLPSAPKKPDPVDALSDEELERAIEIVRDIMAENAARRRPPSLA